MPLQVYQKLVTGVSGRFGRLCKVSLIILHGVLFPETPCKMTGVTFHGVVSPEDVKFHSLLGPVDPSFRGRLEFTVQRHEFNENSLSFFEACTLKSGALSCHWRPLGEVSPSRLTFLYEKRIGSNLSGN